ncbi:uncharacterized protein involved in cysteine biosynthesis [Saonia flava]|uniref:Uncharacterized protein involved in cysteine biosynthesis n=1 Tax=Saonia flava TaxID=523696 RepID=A0A846QQV3_9FLAO|nr:hypothetical protein [Saonia flava]NJB70488.1 uncharacterized protein involved in cysteine biosynthesis [Saonia flava]
MQNNIQNKHIELKINRDFGEIISTYFDFLKQNLKKFTNIFLNYNGIFLIGLLVVSYLLVSGFIGLFTYQQNYSYGNANDMDESYLTYLVIGGILYFIIFIAVAVLNYSLAGAYMINYEKHEGANFDKKEVWDFVKDRLGNIVLFVVLLVLIYIGCSIIGFILAIIPLIGVFAYYILIFFVLGWFGVSFFSMLKDNKGVTDSYGEGWSLTTKNFWKTVGVNFILGLLNGILVFIIMIIPGVIVGIYTFHVVENNVDVSASIVPTIIYTIGTCMFLIVGVFGQCLSQFVNGILYYSLHEKTYNTNTRSKIEQIGNLGE